MSEHQGIIRIYSRKLFILKNIKSFLNKFGAEIGQSNASLATTLIQEQHRDSCTLPVENHYLIPRNYTYKIGQEIL